MHADQRKPKYNATTDHDLLAEFEALTAAGSDLDPKAAEALAEMERLSAGSTIAVDAAALAEFEALTTVDRALDEKSAQALAEMVALTTDNEAVDGNAADALADMERLSAAGAACAERNRAADELALAEFEALSAPEPKKPPAGGDPGYRGPPYGHREERAIFQSQIDLVDAFRPSPRKRRRDHGYER